MSTKKTRTQNAATDDPKKLWNRADRKLAEAIHNEDRVGVREAAELAWLAASSIADVVAEWCEIPQPKGYNSRSAIFQRIDKEYKKNLAGTFRMLRDGLHGEVFHEDDFDSGAGKVLALLEVTGDFVEKALGHRLRRKRK